VVGGEITIHSKIILYGKKSNFLVYVFLIISPEFKKISKVFISSASSVGSCNFTGPTKLSIASAKPSPPHFPT
jgi:hypothetical protein